MQMSVPIATQAVDTAQDVVDPRFVNRARRRRTVVYLVRAAVFVVIFGGWQLFTQLGIVDQFFFGQPTKIVRQAMTWFRDGTPYGSLWTQIGVTLEETVLGFVIGVALGVTLGIALGRVRFLSDVLGPYIKVVNSIPRIVLGAILTVAFGLGLESKVLLVIVLVFFSVFFNAFQGAREVDRNLVNNARILGASRSQVLTSIVVPSATSWIFASLHAAFGFALIGAVVGEYAGADKGLGLLIANTQGTFDAAGIYAGMIITTVIALLAEWLLTLLENRLLRWRPPASSIEAQI